MAPCYMLLYAACSSPQENHTGMAVSTDLLNFLSLSKGREGSHFSFSDSLRRSEDLKGRGKDKRKKGRDIGRGESNCAI